MTPLKIAVSTNYHCLENGREQAYLDKEYFDWLGAYDAVAVPIVPMNENENRDEKIDRLLNDCDGIIFTGGGDIDPGRLPDKAGYDTKDNGHSKWQVYRQENLIHPRRQEFEFYLYRKVLKKKLPLLAICLGIQMINVAHGGSLYGHLADDFAGGVNDASDASGVNHGDWGNKARHRIDIARPSLLDALLGVGNVEVNSFHHQGIKRLGKGLVAVAKSDDGLVEALELSGTNNAANGDSVYNDYPFFLAVQWHPERQPYSEVSRKLMTGFLQAAAGRKNRQEKYTRDV